MIGAQRYVNIFNHTRHIIRMIGAQKVLIMLGVCSFFFFNQIIWVEHNEISLEGCFPVLFKELASSGFVFLAGRWMTMLTHQTENEYSIKQHINSKSIVHLY